MLCCISNQGFKHTIFLFYASTLCSVLSFYAYNFLAKYANIVLEQETTNKKKNKKTKERKSLDKFHINHEQSFNIGFLSILQEIKINQKNL